MSALVVDEGLVTLGNLVISLESVTGRVKIRLFQSPFTITHATVLSDLMAIEANFDGYGYVNATTMTATLDSGLHVVKITMDQAVFTKAGTMTANTIYGYFLEIYDPSYGQRLWFAENFSPAFAVVSPPDTIKVTPECDITFG